MRNPQSVFLLLQYASFMIAYKAEKINLASLKLSEIERLYGQSFDWSSKWLHFRRSRDLEEIRRKSLTNGDDMHAQVRLGADDNLKFTRIARDEKNKYLSRISKLWKTLGRDGKASFGKVTVLIEKAWEAERNAGNAYTRVLRRLHFSRSALAMSLTPPHLARRGPCDGNVACAERLTRSRS